MDGWVFTGNNATLWHHLASWNFGTYQNLSLPKNPRWSHVEEAGRRKEAERKGLEGMRKALNKWRVEGNKENQEETPLKQVEAKKSILEEARGEGRPAGKL